MNARETNPGQTDPTESGRFISGKGTVLLCVLLIVLIAFLAVRAWADKTEKEPIRVALFPYIPNYAYMQELVTEKWAEKNPDIPLEFVYYDCYYDELPQDVDVFMYDTMVGLGMIKGGLMHEIELADIVDSEQTLPGVLDSVRYDSKLYGIPNLLCTSILMFDKADSELAGVETIEDVYRVLGDRKTDGAIPESRDEGLLYNVETDLGYLYLKSLTDHEGSAFPFMPIPLLDKPNMDAVNTMRMMKRMTVSEKDYAVPEYFDRAIAFGQGHGRAYYGYTEHMAYMDDIIDDIAMKRISLSDSENVKTVSVDAVAISSNVKNDFRFEKCLELANIINSAEFQYALSYNNGDLQYLLPARMDAYDRLKEKSPIYGQLYDMISTDDNQPLLYDEFALDRIATEFPKLDAYINAA